MWWNHNVIRITRLRGIIKIYLAQEYVCCTCCKQLLHMDKGISGARKCK